MTVHAYFAEKEALLDLFKDWPDHMGLTVLLEETEGHHISLYHEEERDRVLVRLRHRLGLPPEELVLISPEGVGPEAPEHPRVRIRFSEDREVLDLIRRRRDLPERARDYRINFEYVRDQGLGTGLDADLNPITPDGEEPLVFSPIPKPAERGGEGGWRAEAGGDEPEPLREQPDGPRFAPEPGEEDLAVYDLPADPEQVRSYRVLNGSLRRSGAVVQLRPGRRSGAEERRPSHVLGFRDDLTDFLLPEGVFEGSGSEICVELPLDAFPPALLGGGGAAPRHARIVITPWGVRVRPTPGPIGLIRPWLTRPVLIGAALLAALLAGVTGLLLVR